MTPTSFPLIDNLLAEATREADFQRPGPQAWVSPDAPGKELSECYRHVDPPWAHAMESDAQGGEERDCPVPVD